jgi:hypothetical protein
MIPGKKKTFVNIFDKAAMRNFHYSPLGSAEVNDHVTPIHHAWYLGMMVFIRVYVWGVAPLFLCDTCRLEVLVSRGGSLW